MNLNNIKNMQNALNAYSLRNETISNNLANVNTPGYKREFVKFEEYLSKAGQYYLKGETTNKNHIPIPQSSSGGITVERDMSHSTRLDGNNVNADVEAANQVKNSVMYNAVVQRISGTLQTMKTAITEGGK